MRWAVSNNRALRIEGAVASSITLGTDEMDKTLTESTYEQMDVSSCSTLCPDQGRKR